VQLDKERKNSCIKDQHGSRGAIDSPFLTVDYTECFLLIPKQRNGPAVAGLGFAHGGTKGM
jgi:hypothetical protein